MIRNSHMSLSLVAVFGMFFLGTNLAHGQIFGGGGGGSGNPFENARKRVERGGGNVSNSAKRAGGNINRNVKRQVGRGTRNVRNQVGRGTRNVKRQVGRGTRNVRKQVGRGTRNVKRQTGRSTRNVKRQIGRGTSNVKRQVGRGTRNVKRQVGRGTSNVKRQVGRGTRNVKRQVGRGTSNVKRQVGRGTRNVKRQVGRGTSNVKRQVGRGTRNVKRQVGKGTRNVKRQVGRGTRNVKRQVGKGTSNVKRQVKRGSRTIKKQSGRVVGASKKGLNSANSLRNKAKRIVRDKARRDINRHIQAKKIVGRRAKKHVRDITKGAASAEKRLRNFGKSLDPTVQTDINYPGGGKRRPKPVPGPNIKDPGLEFDTEKRAPNLTSRDRFLKQLREQTAEQNERLREIRQQQLDALKDLTDIEREKTQIQLENLQWELEQLGNRPGRGPGFDLDPGYHDPTIIDAPRDPVIITTPPTDVIDEQIIDQGPIDGGLDELVEEEVDTRPAKRRGGRHLLVSNYTGERITVFIQYRGYKKGKGWTWMPGAPGNSDNAIRLVLEPDEEKYLISTGGKRIAGNRVRIWAETDEAEWPDYRDEDLWLVTEVHEGKRAYFAPEVETFAYQFGGDEGEPDEEE